MRFLGAGAHLVIVQQHNHGDARSPVEKRTVEPAAAGADAAAVQSGADRRRDDQIGLAERLSAQPLARRLRDSEQPLDKLVRAAQPRPVGVPTRTAIGQPPDAGRQDAVPIGELAHEAQRPGFAWTRQVAGDDRALRSE